MGQVLPPLASTDSARRLRTQVPRLAPVFWYSAGVCRFHASRAALDSGGETPAKIVVTCGMTPIGVT